MLGQHRNNLFLLSASTTRSHTIATDNVRLVCSPRRGYSEVVVEDVTFIVNRTVCGPSMFALSQCQNLKPCTSINIQGQLWPRQRVSSSFVEHAHRSDPTCGLTGTCSDMRIFWACSCTPSCSPGRCHVSWNPLEHDRCLPWHQVRGSTVSCPYTSTTGIQTHE